MSRFRFCLRDGRRNGLENSSSWDRGPQRGPKASRWETPTDPGREGLVARISDDYRPQLPVVGKDIPGPAVPCHGGTARLLATVNIQTRSVGCAVRRPYSDSDESDNDVLYTDEHDSTVQQVSLHNNSLPQTAVDSCGERCAQLDDFNWFLPADERAGDLPAPESEIEVSDSENEVEYIEPDSIPLQTEMTTRLGSCYALRWSLRRDLWRAVTQLCPGGCVGDVMS